MNPFEVTWETAEGTGHGPLSLLWELIEAYRVDIFSVSLKTITQDFINHIAKSQFEDLRQASEFMLMAGYLIYQKSRELLPFTDPLDQEEPEDVLPPELIAQLLEYKKFQAAAVLLTETIDEAQTWFTRQPVNVEEVLGVRAGEDELTLELAPLIAAFAKLLKKAQVDSHHEVNITWDDVTVDEKMDLIQSSLKKQDSIEFTLLYNVKQLNRIEIVASFLAILEMVKQRLIRIEQSVLFEKILIMRNDENPFWAE